jgi:calcineurin-like phosphoesterase family protein
VKKVRIFYIADTHFGHANILRLNNRPFYSVEEMDRVMIENWNARVGKEDIVYIIGDFAFRSAVNPTEIIKRLNGRKVLIQGNHDWKSLKDPAFRRCFEEICDRKTIQDNNRKVVMDHFPLIEWDGYIKGRYLVSGHIHNNITNNASKCMRMLDNAVNAGVDINDFMPVTLDEMIVHNQIFKANNH